MSQDKPKIKSLNQFIDALFNTVQKGSYCYRGHTNHTWSIKPSLLRKSRAEAAHIQAASFREFLLNPSGLPYLRSQDPIEHLMLLQHFGIPTKLLDVTMDPLIALFFACYDDHNKHQEIDGKVYIFPVEQYNKLKINTPDLNAYKEGIKPDNIQELFSKRLGNEERLFFEPLIKNPRMRTQDGAFFMFSTLPIEKNDKSFASMEDFHKGVNNKRRENNNDNLMWYGHYLIDRKYKENILKELSHQYGINKTILYVESDLTRAVEEFYKDLHQRSINYYDKLWS